MCTITDFGEVDCYPYEILDGMVMLKNLPLSISVECPDGQIEDCNYNCAPEEWLGDNYCDDGNYFFNGVGINFDCQEFENDGGDCSDDSLSRKIVSYERYMESNVFSNNSTDDEGNCSIISFRHTECPAGYDLLENECFWQDDIAVLNTSMG